MPFRFSEQHIEGYYHHGCTVFRGILPPALIKELRAVTDQAREIAREQRGGQVQRIQPVGKYADRLNLKPFQDYVQLPELNDALQRVLSPHHTLAGVDRLAVLLEPAEHSYCTAWHRDITEQSAGVDAREMRELQKDATFFTQVNCPLYTDTCTWYVPGSDGRPDVSGEQEAAAQAPKLDGKSDAERERLCLEYCQSMPRAMQFVLEPGDFALYRPNGWHIGSYAPYRKRATLHDGVWKPETRMWYQRWFKALEDLKKASA